MMGISFTIPMKTTTCLVMEASWDAELLSGATQMIAPDGRLIHWGAVPFNWQRGFARRLFSVLLQCCWFFFG